MPFVSQQQRKYMYSQEPDLAKEFEKETPKGKTLPKKVKEGADVGQEFDNQVGDMYAVQRAYDGCNPKKLVHKVDPLMGIHEAGIDPTEVHGAYLDEKTAMMMAEKLCNDYTKAAVMLEKKKQQVVDRLKEAIDELEIRRSECIGMIKENPKESGAHKETIAQLATKIDDLMTKLEKIENSKKEIKKDEEKKDLKEGLSKATYLSQDQYQKEKKKSRFDKTVWEWDGDRYIRKKESKDTKKALKEGKFEVMPGKTKSGDPTLLVKKDGVILSNDDIDKLSDSEKQEIADLKKKARVIGPGKSTFKINAPTNYKHDPEDESTW